MIHHSLSVTSLIYQALHPLFLWNCSRNAFKVKPESLSPWVGRDTEFKYAWLMVIMSPPSVDGYRSDIHITKEDTGYDPHFPARSLMGPKVSSRFVKSLQTLFVSDLLSLLVSFCYLRWERSFCQMSEQHGHQPSLSSASSYFDTLKHLPSVKRGRGRHRENNSERASFQPLLAAWSRAHRLSLKPIKGQRSPLPFKAQEDTP